MNENREQQVNRLMRAFQQFGKANWKYAADMPLRHSEGMVLFHLKHSVQAEGIRVTELSQKLSWAPPTLTPILNSLEKTGYITRRHDGEDRRVVWVNITQAGSKMVDDMQKIILDRTGKLMDYLGEKDCFTLILLLDKVSTFLSAQEKARNEKEMTK